MPFSRATSSREAWLRSTEEDSLLQPIASSCAGREGLRSAM
jgi:hypothetical protein